MADSLDGATRPGGLHGTRAEAMQRLKVGVGGLLSMLLVVALASSIMQRAQEAEDPEVVPGKVEPSKAPANDPLVDIGVVPELPGDKEVVVPDLPSDQMPPEVREERQGQGE